MSQRDLVAELRGSHVTAPAEVRARVRALAITETPPARRRFTWRQAVVIALPAAAVLLAAVVVSRPSSSKPSQTAIADTRAAAPVAESRHGAALKAAALAPAPASGRVQRYSAQLGLRLKDAAAVSEGVKRALQITQSLSGHPTSVHADTSGATATADLTVKVPRSRVQEAITRFSQLGTITSENVDVQDLQAGINATDRRIARLQAELAELRKTESTDAVRKRIAALTEQVQFLQRTRAATVQSAHFATVNLHLQTKPKAPPAAHESGPFHGIGVAFRWLGIAAVYVLAFGVPLLLLATLVWLAARLVRRRREDALLGA